MRGGGGFLGKFKNENVCSVKKGTMFRKMFYFK